MNRPRLLVPMPMTPRPSLPDRLLQSCRVLWAVLVLVFWCVFTALCLCVLDHSAILTLIFDFLFHVSVNLTRQLFQLFH